MEDWSCTACGNLVEPMGVLGFRQHGRCRACGLDHSRPLPEPPEEEAEPFANDWKPQP